jgi:hypothetical protein
MTTLQIIIAVIIAIAAVVFFARKQSLKTEAAVKGMTVEALKAEKIAEAAEELKDVIDDLAKEAKPVTEGKTKTNVKKPGKANKKPKSGAPAGSKKKVAKKKTAKKKVAKKKVAKKKAKKTPTKKKK